MIYPFMTLEDNTEITHTEMLADGRVKAYVETPDAKDCFHSLVCWLPSYQIEDVRGYSDKEVGKYVEFIQKAAYLIMEFAQEGGFEHASAV